MNKIERSETLQGLFWPKYYKEIKRLISECEIISESIKTTTFEDIVNLEFDFKRGDKVTIYREFIHAIKKELAEAGIEIIEGVVERHGARGLMDSIYMYDPDGNLVEIAVYRQREF